MFSRFVGMSALFGISIQQIFFFSPLFQSSTSSLHFTFQNLMRTLLIFFFLTLSFSSSFFFLFFFSQFFFFSSLNSCTNHHIETTNQIPSWNTMDKGFKKERLIKRLNGVISDNVSRKKKKNTYMAQSRQKLPNLISQD